MQFRANKDGVRFCAARVAVQIPEALQKWAEGVTGHPPREVYRGLVRLTLKVGFSGASGTVYALEDADKFTLLTGDELRARAVLPEEATAVYTGPLPHYEFRGEGSTI